MILGRSYTLAIVNSAAVNILVQDLFKHLFLIPLGIYTKSGIWGTLSNSTRNFLGKCFPQWLHQFPFPPPMYKDSHFATSSLILVIVHYFRLDPFKWVPNGI